MTIQKIGSIISGQYRTELGSQVQIADDGTVTITENWVMNTTDVSTLVPAMYSVHPSYTGATVTSINYVTLGGGLTRATISWRSTVASFGTVTIGSGSGLFSLNVIGYDNDIAAHPDAATIQATADTNAGGSGLGWLLDDDGLFKGISNSAGNLAGIRSYKSGTLTWTRRWSSNSQLGSAYLDKLHKIDTPDGSPPSLSSPRNWLLDTVSSEQNGTGWTHTATWIASEVGASWNANIYS